MPALRRSLALAGLAAGVLLCTAGDARAQFCTNLTGSLVEKPRLFVGSLDKPAGAHKLSFSGTAEMPHLPQIDLVATGVRFVVDDAQGDVVLDASVPPGVYDAGTKHGWRANGRGGFFYKNNGPTLNGGVFSVTVNELRAAPGTFQFRIKAKNGTYPVLATDLPIQNCGPGVWNGYFAYGGEPGADGQLYPVSFEPRRKRY